MGGGNVETEPGSSQNIQATRHEIMAIRYWTSDETKSKQCAMEVRGIEWCNEWRSEIPKTRTENKGLRKDGHDDE